MTTTLLVLAIGAVITLLIVYVPRIGSEATRIAGELKRDPAERKLVGLLGIVGLIVAFIVILVALLVWLRRPQL